MANLGITSESQSFNNLVVRDAVYASLLLDAAATCAVGQVVQYDTTANNFVDFTSDVTAELYAVVAETKTLSADTQCLCIVKGEVRKSELDATAQADAEIDVALIKSGIIPRGDIVA